MKLPKLNLKRILESFKTRSFRFGGYSIATTAIVIAIAIVANILVNALPSRWTQFDTTYNKVYSISDQTESVVSNLDKEVTIYWIVRDGYEDAYLENLLPQYEDLNSKLDVVQKDPDISPTFATQYTDSVAENSLVVTCGDRYRYLDYRELYVLDQEKYYNENVEEYSFNGESELTSAIDYVVSDNLPKVYLLTGHGESALTSSYAEALEDENVETAELSLLTMEFVPADADCILVNAPQTDISEDEMSKLEQYLGNGGNLILLTNPPQQDKLTNLESLMAGYGVTATDGIVVESDQNYYTWGTPYYLLPKMEIHSITTALSQADYHVVLPIAQGLTVSEELPEGVTVHEVLTTSKSSISKISGYNMTTFEAEEGDITGPFALAVSVTHTLDDGLDSHILWVSSSLLMDESANSMVSGGNMGFFLSMINYLCEPEGNNLTIYAKNTSAEYLVMDTATSSYLTLMMVGIIPAAYLLFGIINTIRRKRR